MKPSSFVESLAPYKITPQDVWSVDSPSDVVKLDWNEAPVVLQWYNDQLKKIINQEGIIAWYPDYLAIELTEELSNFVGIDSNLILTFPGSDVGLETLCRAFLDPGDVVAVLAPTYDNFYVYVAQTGARIVEISSVPPEIPSAEYVSECIERLNSVKAVYIARPNNPFGYMYSLLDIEELASRHSDTMFIIDEAYIEFSHEVSCSIYVERSSNIVVARTFSKAFGMAGVRLGYLCAPVDIINVINKIRNGKNVSMIAQRLGVFALSNFQRVSDWIEQVRKSRAAFEQWCQKKGIPYFPSHGNFVLFKARSPSDLCSELKAQGIYIRNRDQILPGYVRVTIGGASHTQKVIGALSQSLHL